MKSILKCKNISFIRFLFKKFILIIKILTDLNYKYNIFTFYLIYFRVFT